MGAVTKNPIEPKPSSRAWNANVRISACHGYPERRWRSTLPKPNARATPTQISVSPPVTATRNDIYTQRLRNKSQPRPSRAHAHSSSSRRLGVLRLPHESQLRPSGPHARSRSSRRLCVLRLPHESQPRPAAPIAQKALCLAPATRKPSAVWQGYEMSVLCDESCQMSAV